MVRSQIGVHVSEGLGLESKTQINIETTDSEERSSTDSVAATFYLLSSNLTICFVIFAWVSRSECIKTFKNEHKEGHPSSYEKEDKLPVATYRGCHGWGFWKGVHQLCLQRWRVKEASQRHRSESLSLDCRLSESVCSALFLADCISVIMKDFSQSA